MLILALDTASVFCSTALVEDGAVISKSVDNIGKGHAEHLLEQVANIMQQADKKLNQIDRIAVNIGPGSFTGIRVGVAAARALALAIGQPAIGVNAFEALYKQANENYKDKQAIGVILKGSLGRYYWQYFAPNHEFSLQQHVETSSLPKNSPLEEITDFLLTKSVDNPNIILTGNGGQTIADFMQEKTTSSISFADNAPTANIETFAKIALEVEDIKELSAPMPLYLRAPDAKPQNTSPLLHGKNQFRKTSTANTISHTVKKEKPLSSLKQEKAK